jgi:hypothetical protein
MTSPVVVLDTGIYSKLSGSSTLTTLLGGAKIYNRLAPETADPPYVIFQWQGGGEENLTPSRMRNVVYTIKAVSRTLAQAGSIDAAIDGLLTGSTITVSGWTNFWLARGSDIAYAEVDAGGNELWHTGAMWRIRIGAP